MTERMIRYAFGSEPTVERRLMACAAAIENAAAPFVAHRLTDFDQLRRCEMLILDVSAVDGFVHRAFAAWKRLYLRPRLHVVQLSTWGADAGSVVPADVPIRPYRGAINLEALVRSWCVELFEHQPEPPQPLVSQYPPTRYPVTPEV